MCFNINTVSACCVANLRQEVTSRRLITWRMFDATSGNFRLCWCPWSRGRPTSTTLPRPICNRSDLVPTRRLRWSTACQLCKTMWDDASYCFHPRTPVYRVGQIKRDQLTFLLVTNLWTRKRMDLVERKLAQMVPGVRAWTVDLGSHEVKGQGRPSLDSEACRRHHSRSLEQIQA